MHMPSTSVCLSVRLSVRPSQVGVLLNNVYSEAAFSTMAFQKGLEDLNNL